MQRPSLAVSIILGLIVSACTGGTIDSNPPSTSGPAVATSVDLPVPPGATVSISLEEPEALSAHHVLSSAALDVAAMLHTGLTTRSNTGIAEPALAANWTTLDQRTWTFNLKQGMRFNDGTPITAQSFVDSWQALAMQETRARNAYLGLTAGISGWGEVLSGEEGRLIGAVAIDSLSLQVQLNEPFPWLAELLAHPAFAPVAASELANPELFAPVGTGPFRITEPWNPGQVLHLARVWGGGGAGSVSNYQIHFSGSPRHAVELIEQGIVELAVIGDAFAPTGVDIREVPTDTLIYLGFPVTRPPTDEPGIRQGLVHAIDRERIRDQIIGDTSIVTDTYAPQHAAGANLLLCTRCVYDPDVARELLAEIEPPQNSLSLHVVEDTPGELWADAIATLWQDELGWPVAVVRHSLPNLIGFLQAGVPDGPFILEWTSEYTGAESWFAHLFDRSGLEDFTRFSDRNINRSLTALAAMPATSPNRTSHLKDIREVLRDRVPTIPLAVTARRVAFADSIDGNSLWSGSHLGLDHLVWLP